MLQGDGRWRSGTEFLGRFETEVRPKGSNYCFFGTHCRAVSELSIRTPGKARETGAGLPLSPFEEEGVVRIGQLHRHNLNDWGGVEYGFGVASQIRGSGDDLRIRPFYRLGAHFQTLYADGLLGELSLGYLHDRSRSRFIAQPVPPGAAPSFVRQDFHDRVYVEALGLFPNLALGGWRLAARLAADVPLDGDDPADLRASILFYYAFNDWLSSFKPKKPEAKD